MIMRDVINILKLECPDNNSRHKNDSDDDWGISGNSRANVSDFSNC